MKFRKSTFLITSAIFANSVMADNLATTNMNNIVVTATKTPQSIDRVTATVQVITAEDIKKIGATTIKDVFKKTPGLVMQYGTFPSGSSASKSSISLRGMGATGSLWLVDGRRLSGEVSNPYDGDRIPASMIERIEIVKGPMSALYGADAVGGVINIITKQPKDSFKAEVSASAGQNGYGDGGKRNLNASVRGGKDNFRGSFNVSRVTTDPYTEEEQTTTKWGPNAANTPPSGPFASLDPSYDVDVTYREASTVNTVGGRGEIDINEKFTLGAEFNWFEEERNGTFRAEFHPGKNGAGTAPVWDVPVNSKDENTRLDTAIDGTYDVNDDLDLNFRVYKSYYEKKNTTTARDPQDLNYADEAGSASNGMNANVDVISYEVGSNWQVNQDHLLTGGAEYRRESREATVFDSTSGLDTRRVSYKALYLQDDFKVDDTLSFTVGGRYDVYERMSYVDANGDKRGSESDSEATFRVGAVKKLADNMSLRVNLAQGYRVPDIRELFIQKQTPAGLLLGSEAIQGTKTEAYDLQPEKTMSYEVAVSGTSNKFDYSVGAFYNDIKDRIEQLDKGTYITFENVEKAQTYGAEATAAYEFGNGVFGQLSWTELRTNNDETNERLEFQPDRVVSVAVDWMVNDRLTVGGDVTHTSDQYYTEDEGAVEKTAPGYSLVNANASYQIDKQVQIFGGVDNLFNQKVDKELGSNVGSYYFAGVRAEF